MPAEAVQRLLPILCQRGKANNMRRITFLPIIIFFTAILFLSACRRTTMIEYPPVISATGVLVENPGCGHYIVKLLSGAITDSSVLVKSWTDTQTGSTFTNVFTVKDWVLMQQANLSVGDTFSFTLNGTVPDSSKVYNTCDVVPYNLPSASNNVTNIKKLSGERLVGKLVVNGACDNYAVQLISGNIDPTKIVASWPDGDTTYTNVFSVNNRCDFGGYGLKLGDKFSFLLNDTVIVQNCMVCDIYVNVPNIYNTVTGVQRIP